MKILKTIENSDGSATLEMLLDKKETNFFIELGLNKALEDSLINFENSLGITNHEPPKRKKRGGVKR